MKNTTTDAHVSAKELRRWAAWLGSSLVGACVCTAAALAGAGAWLIAPAIVIGPGIGGIALIWLALSSDTNASTHLSVVPEPVEAVATELAA